MTGKIGSFELGSGKLVQSSMGVRGSREANINYSPHCRGRLMIIITHITDLLRGSLRMGYCKCACFK